MKGIVKSILSAAASWLIISSTAASEKAQFPGGDIELAKYIAAAKQYPQAEKIEGQQKVTIKVHFTVERNGHISNVWTSPSQKGAFAHEAVQLVENMPNWIPAEVGGVAQKTDESIDITFDPKLNEKQRASAKPQNYVFRDTMMDDYQRVLRSGKWIFVYKNGTDILPYTYEHMYHYPDGTVKARHNGKWALLNCNQEEILPYEYDDIYYYEDGYCRISQNGKWGLTSSTGKVIVQCRYDTIAPFGAETSFGDTYDEEYTHGAVLMKGLAYAELDGKAGFLNKQGREVINCVYDTMLPFTTGYAVLSQKGKKGLCSDLGKILVSARYEDFDYFFANVAKVRIANKYGLVDLLGQSVLPCKFDTVIRFAQSDFIVMAKKNGYYGLYDISGYPIEECAWDTIMINPSQRNSVLMKKDGVMSQMPLQFESSAGSGDNAWRSLVRLEKDGRWGFATADSQTVFVSPIYDYVDNFYNGYALVKLGGKWGVINSCGRVLVEPKYDFINPYSCGLARVGLNDRMGFIDEMGNEVVKPLYVHVSPFADGQAVVNRNYIINQKGEKVGEYTVPKGQHCEDFKARFAKSFPDYESPMTVAADQCK